MYLKAKLNFSNSNKKSATFIEYFPRDALND